MPAPVRLADLAIPLSGEDLRIQRDAVTDLLQRHHTGFPGAQPVSFCRRHLQELQQKDYFMCEKTDGVRCLLYLTNYVDAHGMLEAQFLIDRKNDFYYVPRDQLHVPAPGDFRSYHTGTLLDGELVRQRRKDGRERLAYLIFDLLAIDGENVTSRTFDKRLARVNERIEKPMRDFKKRYPEDVAAQPFQIEMKQMEFPYATEMMFREKIPNLEHGNDGLIFTCRETGYVFGTDQNILKWKPPHENTIDFRLVIGQFPTLEDDEGVYEDWDAMPTMELHVNHGDKVGYTKFADLTLTQDNWEALKALNTPIDGRIIECYRDDSITERDVWRPKLDGRVPRFRDDKKDANHISVVESVLESIQDAVTEQDLIAAGFNIRRTYKERLARREEEAKRAAEEAKRAEAAEMERRRRAGEEKARRDAEAQRPAEDDGPTYED